MLSFQDRYLLVTYMSGLLEGNKPGRARFVKLSYFVILSKSGDDVYSMPTKSLELNEMPRKGNVVDLLRIQPFWQQTSMWGNIWDLNPPKTLWVELCHFWIGCRRGCCNRSDPRSVKFVTFDTL